MITQIGKCKIRICFLRRIMSSIIQATIYFLLLPIFLSVHPGYGKSVNILFRSRKNEIIILHSTKVHVRYGSKSQSTVETSGCVRSLNNFVDVNVQYRDKLIAMKISDS